jgi:hypothetical protein
MRGPEICLDSVQQVQDQAGESVVSLCSSEDHLTVRSLKLDVCCTERKKWKMIPTLKFFSHAIDIFRDRSNNEKQKAVFLPTSDDQETPDQQE